MTTDNKNLVVSLRKSYAKLDDSKTSDSSITSLYAMSKFLDYCHPIKELAKQGIRNERLPLMRKMEVLLASGIEIREAIVKYCTSRIGMSSILNPELMHDTLCFYIKPSDKQSLTDYMKLLAKGMLAFRPLLANFIGMANVCNNQEILAPALQWATIKNGRIDLFILDSKYDEIVQEANAFMDNQPETLEYSVGILEQFRKAYEQQDDLSCHKVRFKLYVKHLGRVLDFVEGHREQIEQVEGIHTKILFDKAKGVVYLNYKCIEFQEPKEDILAFVGTFIDANGLLPVKMHWADILEILPSQANRTVFPGLGKTSITPEAKAHYDLVYSLSRRADRLLGDKFIVLDDDDGYYQVSRKFL